ncbi:MULTISPECIES: hypothetical protein [unclassified Burkholderia]|uniref:hypothetical protein n=1 Tax=unclassified Burkholderia TaxID=2613784 RepID=UPI000F5704E6|nr:MULTISPECIES: hypothetical protein [unclassified Burkholderia]
MNEPLQTNMSDDVTNVTAPVYCEDAGLIFSAYRRGWGYVAFRLPADVIREKFGSDLETPEQLLAAFEGNRDHVALAISRHAPPESGQRIQLDSSDF